MRWATLRVGSAREGDSELKTGLSKITMNEKLPNMPRKGPKTSLNN